MDEYKDIKDMLTPRREFKASDGLRHRIDSVLEDNTRKKYTFRWVLGLTTSCVAAAMLVLFLLPTQMTAKEILTETINTLLNTGGLEMTVEVRTRPMENFRYIDLSEDFVEHNISIARSDSAIVWRIDKGGRTAAGNDSCIYNWIDRFNIGWRICDAAPRELLGEMAILLSPEKILESELQDCENKPDAHYDLKKKGEDIILTVHSRPQGDFSNPYMLNASIAESENIRRYVIDAGSKRLKSAAISIINGRKASEVLKITNIDYCPARTDLLALPSGIRFIDMPQDSLQGLTGLTAIEAASAFLNALETWNTKVLENAIDANTLEAMYRNEFQGAVLDSIGYAFISGKEGNTYVPYALLMPDGSTKRHTLVLQKAAKGGWIVVGGL